MKIAVFHNLPPGGAKRTIYEQVRYLSKKHHLELFEFASTDENFLDIRKFMNNVYQYQFDIESKFPGFLCRLERDYKNFVALSKVHEKIADDINRKNFNAALVHSDKFTQGPFVLKFLKVPTLYFCQEWLRIVYEKELMFKEDVIFFKRWYELVTRKIRKEIDKKNAQSASKILTNSNFTKTNLKKAYKNDITSCRLGADTKIFKPVSNKRKKYILFIGEKAEINGYPLLENAVKSVDKKIRPTIKVISFRKGKIQITDEALAKVYSSALAVACTSYNEPFGLAPIESMACQTPVLAVNDGGYRETILDGKTGYLLKRDPKEFAERIVYLIKYPEVAKEMGQEGRKHIINNFSWERHNKLLEKHIISIAETAKTSNVKG